MLRESLRPWRNAGLEFVFDEYGVFEAAQQQAEAEQPAPRPQRMTAQPAAHGAGRRDMPPEAMPHAPSDSYGRQQPPRSSRDGGQPSHARAYAERQKANVARAPHPGAPSAQSGQSRGPASNVRPMGTGGLTVHPTAQPPEEWPAAWQAMWGKVRQPSPVVWTYWSLGDDLSGRANAERGALLRKIIGSLQLPAGSSSFWPVALPEQGSDEGSELVAAPEIFLAGLRRVRPRYCITFGSKALRTFAPDAGLMPYTFTQFLGHRLIALPDIDILLTNQGTVPAVIAFLRTAVNLRGPA